MSPPGTTVIGRVVGYIRPYLGQSIVKGFALSPVACRHSEAVGLVPAREWVDDDLASGVAHLVGVGAFARVQGLAETAFLGEVRGVDEVVGLRVIAHGKRFPAALGGDHPAGAATAADATSPTGHHRAARSHGVPGRTRLNGMPEARRVTQEPTAATNASISPTISGPAGV
jgi:hypothetical protein